MQVAPNTKITFNLYSTLCGLSAKFRELFNKSDIKQDNINEISQNNENYTTETDDKMPRFCPQCGTELKNRPAFCGNCGTKINTNISQIAQ